MNVIALHPVMERILFRKIFIVSIIVVSYIVTKMSEIFASDFTSLPSYIFIEASTKEGRNKEEPSRLKFSTKLFYYRSPILPIKFLSNAAKHRDRWITRDLQKTCCPSFSNNARRTIFNNAILWIRYKKNVFPKIKIFNNIYKTSDISD